MKTMYMNGATGTAAIIDGEDLSILDDPYNNTDKIYFNSNFDYLYKVGSISGSSIFPYLGGTISTGYFSNTKDLVGTLPWDSSASPLIVGTFNSLPAYGQTEVQRNNNRCFRFAGLEYNIANGLLSVYSREFALAINTPLASITLDISLDIFSYTDTTTLDNNIISLEGDQVIFGRGKFNSNNTYGKLLSSSNKRIATNKTITPIKYDYTYSIPSSIGITS